MPSTYLLYNSECFLSTVETRLEFQSASVRITCSLFHLAVTQSINPGIGRKLPRFYHLIYEIHPNIKHRLHDGFNIQTWWMYASHSVAKR